MDDSSGTSINPIMSMADVSAGDSDAGLGGASTATAATAAAGAAEKSSMASAYPSRTLRHQVSSLEPEVWTVDEGA